MLVELTGSTCAFCKEGTIVWIDIPRLFMCKECGYVAGDDAPTFSITRITGFSNRWDYTAEIDLTDR